MDTMEAVVPKDETGPRRAGLCRWFTRIGVFGVVYVVLCGVLTVRSFADDGSIMAARLCEMIGLVVVPLSGVCLVASVLLQRRPMRVVVTRLSVLACLAVLSGVYQFQSAELADIGMRARVGSGSDVGRLQAWAEELLRRPASELPIDREWTQPGQLALRRDQVPAFVRRLGSWHGPVIVTERDGSRYVRLSFLESHAGSYGLYLGVPSLGIPPDPNEDVRRWRPGVFAWRSQLD